MCDPNHCGWMHLQGTLNTERYGRRGVLGIIKLAYKLLVNDRAKFSALLVGITFAVFLIIMMTSIFAGVLNRASATVINIGASIWVMDPSVQR